MVVEHYELSCNSNNIYFKIEYEDITSGSTNRICGLKHEIKSISFSCKDKTTTLSLETYKYNELLEHFKDVINTNKFECIKKESEFQNFNLLIGNIIIERSISISFLNKKNSEIISRNKEFCIEWVTFLNILFQKLFKAENLVDYSYNKKDRTCFIFLKENFITKKNLEKDQKINKLSVLALDTYKIENDLTKETISQIIGVYSHFSLSSEDPSKIKLDKHLFAIDTIGNAYQITYKPTRCKGRVTYSLKQNEPCNVYQIILNENSESSSTPITLLIYDREVGCGKYEGIELFLSTHRNILNSKPIAKKIFLKKIELPSKEDNLDLLELFMMLFTNKKQRFDDFINKNRKFLDTYKEYLPRKLILESPHEITSEENIEDSFKDLFDGDFELIWKTINNSFLYFKH
jgi:hypothetical protein